MVYRLKVNVTSGALWKGQKVERVMEVPGTCTLKDLCLGILDAIDFDLTTCLSLRSGAALTRGSLMKTERLPTEGMPGPGCLP